MSEKVGSRSVGKEVCPGVNELVDEENQRILQESYERAKVLQEHRNELQALAEALMKHDIQSFWWQ